MADIRVNDIFEELIEENVKITECLNVLIKFKTFVDLVFDKLKTNLESNVLQLFEDFNKEAEDVFKRNKKDFSVDNNLIQRKSQLSQSVSSHSRNSSNDSIEFRSMPRLLKKSSNYDRSLIPSDVEIDENQRYICGFIGCGQRLKNRDSWRSHQRLHSSNPKPFKCDFDGCGFATRSKTGLKDHINAHKGIKPYNCHICGKAFSAEKYIKQHIDVMHKVTDQVLVCELEECYKEFKTELSFRNHQKMHLMEKRFECKECSFKAIRPSILKQHVDKVHSKVRPFACQMVGCSKSYKCRNELRIHMFSHSSERNFKCLFDGCDKAYKTSQDLRKHSAIHSGIEHRCDWPGCEYTTKNIKALRSHQTIHSCERNFFCGWPECGKRFKTKIQLETHLRIHRSDKKYTCSWPGCHYRCTDSGNLIKHRRVHIRN